MNFGKVIKEEIISKPIKESRCRKAFIAGVMRGGGKIVSRGEEFGIDFTLPDERSAFTVAEYIETEYAYQVREIELSEDRLNKKDVCTVSVIGRVAEKILTDLLILKQEGESLVVNFDIFGGVADENGCLRAFIKGLFLAVGTCNVPAGAISKKGGYVLEIPFSHGGPAIQTVDRLLKNGIKSKIMRRKDNYILYIKNIDDIANFVAFLPAPLAVLKLTDLAINRQMSNNSNRQKNCDMANLNKQVEASLRMAEDIKFIDKTVGLTSLKKELHDVAVMRLEYGEDTLTELAERLGVTKSCLNHRLRKLSEIAKELKEKYNV